MNEPVLSPGWWRGALALAALIAFLTVVKFGFDAYVGHTYANDPLCLFEHQTACQVWVKHRGNTDPLGINGR